MGCLILFLKVWQPKQLWLSPALRGRDESAATMTAPKPMDKTPLTQSELFSALLPWIIVCIVMLIWGNGAFKTWANSIFTWNYPVPDLHNITSEQLGLSPILMGAANSSGGVMGKMIDAQSIVVASTATNWYGHEGSILRYVFLHSIVLACLVGILVTLQAYVYPFTAMVLK